MCISKVALPKTKQGPARYRNNNDYLKNDSIPDFLKTSVTSFRTTLKTLSMIFI